MPSGYFRKKPDLDWWMQELLAGVAYREEYALEDQWDKWRQYYRGRWKKGILPRNIFFQMIRTIVPRVYFRNPMVSLTPGEPGLENMLFAQLLQRVDNKLILQMDVKREMKRAVQHTVMFGTGFGKLGFGALYTPVPEAGITFQPIENDGERFEYRDDTFTNMPWFSAVHPGNIVLQAGSTSVETSRFIAHWERRPVDDIKGDSRFSNTKDIGPSDILGHRGSSRQSNFSRRRQGATSENIDFLTDIIEVRDKKMNRVFVFSPGGSSAEPALLRDEEDSLSIHGRPPIYDLIFNEDDEVAWGVPDSALLEPYQKEINEIRTQTMKHRRASMIKFLVQKGAIDPSEREKLLSEDVGAYVEVNDTPANVITKVDMGGIPDALFQSEEGVLRDVRETIGFSRNQLGEHQKPSARTSATEADIVNRASEIRVDERRDQVADMLVKMVGDMHNLIFTHWQQEQREQIIGPGGRPLWVRFTPQMIAKGNFQVKVDPDSSLPETQDRRQARAMAFYERLKTNPLIDPIKLTQYLLTELPGVQFDDMMRMLPAAENQPDEIDANEIGGLVQNQLQAGGSGGGNLLPFPSTPGTLA